MLVSWFKNTLKTQTDDCPIKNPGYERWVFYWACDLVL